MTFLVEDGKIEQGHRFVNIQINLSFCYCYFAVPVLTLGDYQGTGFTDLLLITVF